MERLAVRPSYTHQLSKPESIEGAGVMIVFGVPGATRGRPQESGGDPKTTYAEKFFCDGRTHERTDRQT